MDLRRYVSQSRHQKGGDSWPTCAVLKPGTGRSRSRQWPHQAFHIGMQGVLSLQNHPSAQARTEWKWILDVKNARQGPLYREGNVNCAVQYFRASVESTSKFMHEVKPFLFVVSFPKMCPLYQGFSNGFDG